MKYTTIVILSYNRKEYLERSLESLWENTTLPYELIIVDDGSGVKTQEYIHSLVIKKKISTAIFNCGKNMGIGVGLNRAFKMSNADYLIKADADIEYLPNWLEKGVKTLEDDKVGMVGFFDYDNYCPEHYKGRNYKKEHNDYIEVKDFVSSVFMIRNKDYKKFGNFIESERHFAEDVDYKDRMHDKELLMAITKKDTVKNFGFGHQHSSLIKKWKGDAKKSEYNIPTHQPLIFNK